TCTWTSSGQGCARADVSERQSPAVAAPAVPIAPRTGTASAAGAASATRQRAQRPNDGPRSAGGLDLPADLTARVVLRLDVHVRRAALDRLQDGRAEQRTPRDGRLARAAAAERDDDLARLARRRLLDVRGRRLAAETLERQCPHERRAFERGREGAYGFLRD